MILCVSCAHAQSETEPPTPTYEQLLHEEEEYIIDMCEGLFENKSTIRTCILFNLYALHKSDRLERESWGTSDYIECLDPEYYFAEYKTFWYPSVLRCLEKKREWREKSK
jgi:hypothetical protein